jgi:hypothetical protein
LVRLMAGISSSTLVARKTTSINCGRSHMSSPHYR